MSISSYVLLLIFFCIFNLILNVSSKYKIIETNYLFLRNTFPEIKNVPLIFQRQAYVLVLKLALSRAAWPNKVARSFAQCLVTGVMSLQHERSILRVSEVFMPRGSLTYG